MKLNAFIFDLDGTLADTEQQHYRAWREVLLANGVREFSEETFVSYVGTSNEKVAEDYIKSGGIDKSVARLIEEKRLRYRELLPEVSLCAGVREIVEKYRGRVKLAVATSSHTTEAEDILEIHGLRECFPIIVGGEKVQRKKPDPEIYCTASRLLQVDPGRCLAFEDSGPGVASAKAAGMACIAVPNGYSRHHDFALADQLVAELGDIDDQLIGRLVLPG